MNNTVRLAIMELNFIRSAFKPIHRVQLDKIHSWTLRLRLYQTVH